MDHFEYTTRLEEEEEEEQIYASGECYNNIVNDNHKYGDELLIDLVRSRPYLYDKTHREYKDMKMKENAWGEMADVMNMTVSDCQTRWTRLRQRYSKERNLNEQETRSGAGKSTRPKWFLFESLNFLEKHMVHRKSITNMSLSQSSTSIMHQANKGINQNEDFRIREEMTLPQVTTQRSFSQNISMISRNNISALELERPWTPSPLQHQPQLSDSAIKQIDNFILAPTHIPDTQPALILTPPPSQQTIASTQRSTNSPSQQSIASTQRSTISPSERLAASSPQRSTASSSDLDSEILNPPSACFIRNKPGKRQKIEPIESAFSQINTTLSTMATQIYSKKNPTSDNDDPDILIGKLVTAELKKTPESRKNILKKKFMDILYNCDTT